MIPFASQRGGAADLATHLLNEYDNEQAEVVQVRGAIAKDLHGAFKEWEVQADAFTRCEKFLYSLSINPDPKQAPLTREQYMDYIARTEDMLGLKDQPRAIVFHTKYGREHCHVVWSRVDAQEKRAVHLAFDHEKLMRVTRAFARDHNITLPKGYEKSRDVGQITLYEQEQARRTGLTKADHTRNVTEAWQQSDSPRAFVRALAERGYMLATGNRPYLVVDIYGNVNALPKLIDDRSVRTADLRAFLGKEYPPESLPSIEEAEKIVAGYRETIERDLDAERAAEERENLRQAQNERLGALARERRAMEQTQREARLTQERAHCAARDTLRQNYRASVISVRAAREQDRPTGLAAFLGRITGVDLLRRSLHRYQDAQRFKAYRDERRALKEQQASATAMLESRTRMQGQELDRREAALSKVEQRELAGLARDQRAAQRAKDRGPDGNMPSLEHLIPSAPEQTRGPDVLAAFAEARDRATREAPDLLGAFQRAAKDRDQEGEGESGELDQDNAPDANKRDGPDRGGGRGR